METLLSVFFFIFGTIIGSFLNVVILRHNTGKSLSGRSGCASCGESLSAGELIPILSFFALHGKCRSCGSRISIQYPLVELFTGAIFFFTFLTFGLTLETAIFLIASSLLVVIFVYDLLHKIVPDDFVYPFILLAFASLFVDPISLIFTTPTLLEVASGVLIAFPVWFLWIVSGGRWIGLGDAKLFLGVGWFLGLTQGITAFVFAFWGGALVSSVLLYTSRFVQKHKLNLRMKALTMKSEVPFAPFIIISFFLTLFLHLDIIRFLLL